MKENNRIWLSIAFFIMFTLVFFTLSLTACDTPCDCVSNNAQAADCLAANVCTKCGTEMNAAKSSHSFPAADCTAACQDCGTESPHSAHAYDDADDMVCNRCPHDRTPTGTTCDCTAECSEGHCIEDPCCEADDCDCEPCDCVSDPCEGVHNYADDNCLTECSNAACNNKRYNAHNFSDDLETSDTEHWKVCTRQGCEEIYGLDDHTFNGVKCSVCDVLKAGVVWFHDFVWDVAGDSNTVNLTTITDGKAQPSDIIYDEELMEHRIRHIEIYLTSDTGITTWQDPGTLMPFGGMSGFRWSAHDMNTMNITFAAQPASARIALRIVKFEEPL